MCIALPRLRSFRAPGFHLLSLALLISCIDSAAAADKKISLTTFRERALQYAALGSIRPDAIACIRDRSDNLVPHKVASVRKVRGRSTLTLRKITSRTTSRSKLAALTRKCEAKMDQAEARCAPSATSLQVSVPEMASASFTLTGSGGCGETLSYEITRLPATGTITGAIPTLTYSAGFRGSSLEYVAASRYARSAPAVVTLSVTPLGGDLRG